MSLQASGGSSADFLYENGRASSSDVASHRGSQLWLAEQGRLKRKNNYDVNQPNHRRRIELEDKAKVLASDWGTESLLC